MKVRAQIGKVLNLDKCIGCHTCSVTCKKIIIQYKNLYRNFVLHDCA
jgi:nitrate reductase beta subunit